MAVHRFYPHRVAEPGAVRLALSELPKGVTQRPDGALDAYTEAPDEVVLTFHASADEVKIAETLPVGASGPDQVDFVVKAAGIASRQRHAASVECGNPDSPTAVDLTLCRADWAGEVTVELLAVRSSAGPHMVGLASDRGALLGWSEPLRVIFDEAPLPPGASLEVRWIRFSEDSSLSDGHLFAFRDTESAPVLLLNLDFENAYTVLSSRGTRGARARIRDATYYQIVHQGWSSMLAAAFSALRGAALDLGDDGESPFEEIATWQATILRDWAPWLFPETGDPESAAEKLLELSLNAHTGEFFITRLPRAIQERLDTAKGFRGLVKDARLFGDDK